MIIVMSIWIIGNTTYLPDTQFANDVIIRNITDPNQVFLDSVADDFIYTGENYRSNYPLPVVYESYLTYTG